MPGKELSLQIKIAGKVDSTLKSALGVLGSGIGGAVKVMGGLATAGAAAVGAIGAASIKVGKEFESSMSSLAATAGINTATAEGQAAFQQLETAAREAGKTTTKTAAEAADALNYMALAGWDVNTSVEALIPVLRLSEASGMDLAETSDLVTDSMSAMGVTVDELADYLDVCAAASTASNMDISDMATSIIKSGGAARAAGMDYRDTATALGIFANNGLKGARAGTTLNSMLVRIATNNEAAKAFDELGVAVYDAEGNMRGLQDILVDTNEAFSGLTAEQQNAYSKLIAGTSYFSQFQYLLDGVTESVDGQGSAWDNLYEELNTCQGALDQMAATKTDNLEGDISRLGSAASDLGISIYQGMTTPLREAAQMGTDMMTQLSAAFDEGGFAGLSGALGGCLAEAVETIASYAPSLIDSGVQVVSSFIQGIGDNAPQVAASAASILTSFVQGIFTLLPQVGTVGIQVILALVQSLIAQAPMLFQAATTGIVNFINGLSQNLPAILQTGFQLILALIQGILTSLPQIIAAGAQLVGELIMTILNTDWIEVGTSILSAIGQGLVGGIKGIGGAFINGVKGLFGGGDADVSDEGAAVTETYAAGIESNSSVVSDAASNVATTAFSNMDFSGLTDAGMQSMDMFSSGIMDNLPLVTTAAEDITTTAFADMDFSILEDAGLSSMEAYSNSLTDNIPLATAAAEDITTTAFADMDFSILEDAGLSSMEAYSGAITDNISLATAAAEQMTSEAFGDMDLGALEEAGLLSVETYGDAVSSNASLVTAAADSMSDDIVDSLDAGWSAAEASADSAMKSLASTVTSEAQSAASAVKVAFENMTITIPKPRVPVITTSYRTETYGDGGSIQIPQFSVSWNAIGGILDGIFTDPTVLATSQGLQGVGEAGPEAILPLDTLWAQLRQIMTDILRSESGESIVQMLLDKLRSFEVPSPGSAEEGYAFADAGGGNITYAPTYNLYGSATKQDAIDAETISQAEFAKLMRQYERNNTRTRF